MLSWTARRGDMVNLPSLQDIPIDPSKIKRVPLEPNERRLYPFADYVLQYGEKRVPVRSAPMGRIDQKRLRRNRVSVQYIGTSPNVALSVRHHLQRFGPDTCQFVRVCVFPSMDVANMEALKQAWIAEIGRSKAPASKPCLRPVYWHQS
jgi:hypothetical protein